MEFYAVSHDDKQVAFSLKDQNGISHVWLAPTDHRSSPRQLASATSQDSPLFLPNGDLVLRSTENGQNFLYRTSQDGTERRKIAPEPILDVYSVSPDGRWVVAPARGTDDEHPYAVAAYPLDGGQSLRVCKSYCLARWDISGKFFYLTFPAAGELTTYMLPVSRARGIPNFPVGITTAAELNADNRVLVIPQQIESAVGPHYYSYTRQNTRRNIYRLPVPQ
jgi:hypothetical protein